jgi:hypothetical protein
MNVKPEDKRYGCRENKPLHFVGRCPNDGKKLGFRDILLEKIKLRV